MSDIQWLIRCTPNDLAVMVDSGYCVDLYWRNELIISFPHLERRVYKEEIFCVMIQEPVNTTIKISSWDAAAAYAREILGINKTIKITEITKGDQNQRDAGAFINQKYRSTEHAPS